jgi:hypothetical protein
MLTGELNHHLGYQKHEVASHGSGNSRNGKSQKTLKGKAGEIMEGEKSVLGLWTNNTDRARLRGLSQTFQ